ncbi:endolytic transglycosylase MltG [Chitinophaga lutea]|uniref:Endolytic murein transglycosylase n=1 Tax=Chitinophaga lutea TaxID=2488634 RepID=A0A3N4PDW9_9BACT|nr:endolytic transglycosylase MltG [Chitinophaga lutea]RPE05628.1 endolytic transglycosylase MltG [Chitinophaga lutea]
MKRTKAQNTNSPWIRRIAVILACLLAGGMVLAAYLLMGPNTKSFGDKKYFYVPTGSSYDDVLKGLEEQGIVRSVSTFNVVARRLDYPARVKAGRYEIKKGMGNLEIVRILRSGRQSPVKLVINKLRLKEDFIRLVSTNLEADSAAMKAILEDGVYLRQFGLDTNTVMCAILPNTYEFYWNTNAGKVFDKIESAYENFWTDERQAKAAKLGLRPTEVTVLASIVEEETNKHDEKPAIASVYLNRLRQGMKLGADPTVKFAMKNFALKRIWGSYLEFDSPYNTYRYSGLPPGPICTPSAKSIDAVLTPADTEYLYFCARADFSGYHAFASTYKEHLENAKEYQKALNARGVK